jgi:hypothetical protein
MTLTIDYKNGLSETIETKMLIFSELCFTVNKNGNPESIPMKDIKTVVVEESTL